MSDNKTEVQSIDGVRKYGDGFEGGLKVIKEVANYNKEYIQEVVEKATDLAAKKFIQKSGPDTVRFSTPFGISTRGSVDIDIKREVEFSVPGTDKKVKKSSISVRVKDPASAMGKSEIRKLANRLTDQFVNK